MTKLLLNDWLSNPSIQLISVITEDDSDHSYHDHNFYEIFYVLDGTIVHNINGKKEILHVGDARLLRPKDKHSFIRESGTRCAHRDIIISETLFQKTCDFINASAFEEINRQRDPLKAVFSNAKIVEFENEFSKFIFTSTDNRLYTKETIANILSVDLLSIFLQTSQTENNVLPSWLNTLLPSFSVPDRMRAGLDLLLQDVSYDKSYVCRTFKKYMGCTMTEYLRNQRIEYATSLLLTTDKTVAQICDEIGFDSIPYFTMAFKQRHNLSPKQFKMKFVRHAPKK